MQDILSNCTVYDSVEVLPHRRMNLHLHKAVNFTGEMVFQAEWYTGGQARPIAKWELLRKFPFLIGATVIQLDGRLSFGWVVWCPLGGGLDMFLKKVIITTIQAIISCPFQIFLDFQNFYRRFVFLFILFCFLSELLFENSASDALEVIQKRHRACLLNFWNIFWREIYNGVIENRSVASRHDYKGGII